MYHSNNFYPVYSPMPLYPEPLPFRKQYPKIDVTMFSSSVKSFQMLMGQSSMLLEHLGNPAFAYKIMEAAQQGKSQEVDRLIQSIGLKVPVTTKYTPTGVTFTLQTRVQSNNPSCCTLTIPMKWGK
ncbi:hypothetical protein ELQ35_02345 [Peribacillus cavernae]|uniref:Uncharacterized protein n=1 Tax=Peribacillus cavernae TaxID=1674310 RepID=A0A433HUN6_9BACI|nr:hypothetical protein [Peribacillus cavernae]MDQ0219988.1 hypothetical protein [Peribacillus cavernae]RUQ32053.1 hypothetical protein ELQ35_02345 [Peribacillus cavernae]